MEKGFRIVEHPSDVGFTAWGPTVEDLLDVAVAALAHVETGGVAPAGDERRAAPSEGEPEERLMRLLEHCLILLDSEDWLAVGLAADGQLRGEPLPADARAAGTHVKAVTWHGLVVEPAEGGWRATVFLDL